MPDLIDRTAVLETVFNIMSDGKIVHKHRALNRNIKQIPKADTERHAYWRPMNEHIVYCSHCKTILEIDKLNFHRWKKQNKFCRNCGCKMDKTHVL